MSALFTGWTVLVCIIFLSIVAWAWSSRRKQEFDAAAHMILNDDDTSREPHDA